MIHVRNLISWDKVYSRWLILLVDLFIVVISICLAFSLKSQLDFTNYYDFYYILSYCSSAVLVFMVMRIHTCIIRYSNTRDMMRIFITMLICNIAFFFFCKMLVEAYFINLHKEILLDILTINFFISTSLLMGMRIAIKDLFKYLEGPKAFIKKENVLVYGSGAASILLKNTIEGQKSVAVNVQGFIDAETDKIYKYLEQKRVYPIYALERLKQKFSVKKMLVTAEEISCNGKRKAIEKCIELGIKVITVPPADQWINGKPNVSQFKDLKIEDLLQRAPIELSKEHIFSELSGKRILVTGAAGSIGSELVRQILTYNPKYVVLCDQAETPLHNMQLETEDQHYHDKTKIFVADVKNTHRIRTLFSEFMPQIVFHAAAYKHVPMMENNPTEAILTNIWGTKNIADISIEFGVEKFVMISTDKAVRPTNVMGATKRIAEMYIQSLNNVLLEKQDNCITQQSGFTTTKFITTRFGNVLGSNGSVIPRFKEQIEKGGPVTVTHPEIIRYFMTIPEAVQLVLEGAVMGKGAEIFLFDMGKPIKIADLAANMIRLAGLTPGKDIDIVFTGLRPGEKLYEELLNFEEEVLLTYNENIKVSKAIPASYMKVNKLIEELVELGCENNVDLMITKLKSILPDYISNNSRYEKLDLELALSKC